MQLTYTYYRCYYYCYYYRYCCNDAMITAM